MSESKESQTSEYTGRILGPYRVGAWVGEGSFGQVYKAVDTRSGHVVALKILLSLPRTEGTRARFNHLRETVLPALEHPRVLQPLEPARQTEEGVVYFATRLIESGNLRDRLDRNRFSWKQAARVVHSLADTLVEVHKQLIHQDLKPENILVDRNGTPYIIDLGLAMLQDQRHAQRHDAAGTWPYMAPEVFRRFHVDEFPDQESEPSDAKADIYSLGLILYELLTGRYAFGDRNDFNARRASIGSAPQSPGVLRPDIPIDLVKVCMHCLAPDPGQRISSAAELRAALAPFAKWYPAWKPVAAAGIIASSLLVLAVTQIQLMQGGASQTPTTPVSGDLSARQTKTDEGIRPEERKKPEVGSQARADSDQPARSIITLTVILKDTREQPVLGARVEVLSSYFDGQGLKLPPPATTNAMGEAQFTLQAQPADVQFSATHEDYCPSRWTVPLGNANESLRHQLKSRRMTAVLDNGGSRTLILKTVKENSLPALESENQVGYADVGTEVALSGPLANSSSVLRMTRVEVLSGVLTGKAGWVSSGVLRDIASRCP